MRVPFQTRSTSLWNSFALFAFPTLSDSCPRSQHQPSFFIVHLNNPRWFCHRDSGTPNFELLHPGAWTINCGKTLQDALEKTHLTYDPLRPDLPCTAGYTILSYDNQVSLRFYLKTLSQINLSFSVSDQQTLVASILAICDAECYLKIFVVFRIARTVQDDTILRD